MLPTLSLTNVSLNESAYAWRSERGMTYEVDCRTVPQARWLSRRMVGREMANDQYSTHYIHTNNITLHNQDNESQT